MQGIEFETDQNQAAAFEPSAPKGSGIIKIIMKFGINDSTTANMIILGIIALLFGVAIFLYAGILSNGSIVPSTPTDMMHR